MNSREILSGNFSAFGITKKVGRFYPGYSNAFGRKNRKSREILSGNIRAFGRKNGRDILSGNFKASGREKRKVGRLYPGYINAFVKTNRKSREILSGNISAFEKKGK